MSTINKKLVNRIKNFFKSANKQKAVIGLSGGIDSALVCSLLVEAIGKQNVTALILPFNGVSSKENIQDAQNFAKKLGVKTILQEINSFSEPFSSLPWKQTNLSKTNTLPRLRAIILYNYANSNDCLVVGTGNKTELMLGYFTKYGDGAADFFPIGTLWKTKVYELAKERKLPIEFLEKTPTAELWVGQTDEKELGLTYKEMDEMLVKLVDKGKKVSELVKMGYSKDKLIHLNKLVSGSRHKRLTPPIL